MTMAGTSAYRRPTSCATAAIPAPARMTKPITPGEMYRSANQCPTSRSDATAKAIGNTVMAMTIVPARRSRFTSANAPMQANASSAMTVRPRSAVPSAETVNARASEAKNAASSCGNVVPGDGPGSERYSTKNSAAIPAAIAASFHCRTSNAVAAMATTSGAATALV